MIRDFEAAEFISMLALNEMKDGKNTLHISMDELTESAREIERANSGVRINLSTDSLQSFFCRSQAYVRIQHEYIVVADIHEGYNFLRAYASIDTLSQIRN